MKSRVNPGLASLVVAVALATSFTWVNAQQNSRVTIALDPDDIGGVVASSKGPEAGVWVIAETTDLPTKFAKMVVTDDQGRYVLPDLPRANYEVFVRGTASWIRRGFAPGLASASTSRRSSRRTGAPPRRCIRQVTG